VHDAAPLSFEKHTHSGAPRRPFCVTSHRPAEIVPNFRKRTRKFRTESFGRRLCQILDEDQSLSDGTNSTS
jgi:hypothetical protein